MLGTSYKSKVKHSDVVILVELFCWLVIILCCWKKRHSDVVLFIIVFLFLFFNYFFGSFLDANVLIFQYSIMFVFCHEEWNIMDRI